MIPPGYGFICHACGLVKEFELYHERNEFADAHECPKQTGT